VRRERRTLQREVGNTNLRKWRVVRKQGPARQKEFCRKKPCTHCLHLRKHSGRKAYHRKGCYDSQTRGDSKQNLSTSGLKKVGTFAVRGTTARRGKLRAGAGEEETSVSSVSERSLKTDRRLREGVSLHLGYSEFASTAA